MAVGEDDNTPLPGTVFTSRQVRILKVVVIAMGVLLAGGLAFVLAVIAYQASQMRQEAAPAPEQGASPIELSLAQDGTVSNMSLDGDRLALHLNSNAGSEIVVIDLASGKVVARVRLAPDKP
jgi:hypothetical protein